MKLVTLPGVFRPCSDSWMLADIVEREPLAPGARVLDLGSGSGVLAVAAARKTAEVTAVDVSRRAVTTTWLNARLNGVSVRAVRGDLFAPVRGERFALIVSNPPYLPSANDGPPRGPARAWEAGRSGRALVDRICVEAHDHLRPGGVVLLVHSSVCGEQATLTALGERGLRTRVVARHRGPLGPRLARLRERGLLPHDLAEEEMLVIRAERPA
ncbi:MAG TPA: HemK2/MTQ2 family protein methyltransferase [Solirubrobacteraceae bacterium]|nr:HemK2/MTQ2 family protein methyltransferase [Solirubrobacteraceae bacterium]